MGATVDDGWVMTALDAVGDVSDAVPEAADGDEVPAEPSASLATPLIPLTPSIGFTALGFVIGMADFCTVRAAIALALARWCGERDARII